MPRPGSLTVQRDGWISRWVCVSRQLRWHSPALNDEQSPPPTSGWQVGPVWAGRLRRPDGACSCPVASAANDHKLVQRQGFVLTVLEARGPKPGCQGQAPYEGSGEGPSRVFRTLVAPGALWLEAVSLHSLFLSARHGPLCCARLVLRSLPRPAFHKDAALLGLGPTQDPARSRFEIFS